jgi:hypothetical protein
VRLLRREFVRRDRLSAAYQERLAVSAIGKAGAAKTIGSENNVGYVFR